jgi:hypothetical protein
VSEPADDAHADAGLMAAVPGLVRIAAGAWWRTAEWTVGVSLRAGSRLVQAAASGESPAQFLQEVGTELRGYARELLGVLDGEDRVRSAGPDPGARPARGTSGRPRRGPTSLRDRGAELLRQSADVRYEEGAHPAYERILTELAPDEGRILRLLALQGPQPAVDVRTGGPLATLNVASQLVAPGLSMIGAQAGCRFVERVPAYLNNLYRLGLIWFSREPLEDPLRYQVLEAQPDVLEAMRNAGRGRTVRRSIHLTPFGEDFCSTCLPLHTDELEALPGGSAAEPGTTAAEGDGTATDVPPAGSSGAGGTDPSRGGTTGAA